MSLLADPPSEPAVQAACDEDVASDGYVVNPTRVLVVATVAYGRPPSA